MPNVSTPFNRLARRALLALCLPAVLASPGCRWLTGGRLHENAFPSSESSRPAETAKPADDVSTADASADRAVLLRAVIDDDGRSHSVWIRVIRPPAGDAGAESRYRWRNPAVEELMARPARLRPDLHAYLRDKDPIVATHAAIFLARDGDGDGDERLAAAVRNPALRLPMRCAAVEALANLPSPETVQRLRELLDQYGRRATAGPSAYNAPLHGELIRALGRHVAPSEDARFVNALRSRSADVRLAALQAWSAMPRGDLPDEAAKLCDDRDRNVRAAALAAVARHHHPQADTYLTAALLDHDLHVRTSAIAALGALGNAEARTTLEKLLKDPSNRNRADAVAALANLAAKHLVLPAADDKAWCVRENVAAALGRWPDRDGRAAAQKLLDDPSVRVREVLVSALAEWPLEHAGPILLAALDDGSFAVRQEAAEQLAAQWPAAADFPASGAEERRRAVLGKLQGEFRRRFPTVGVPAASPIAPQPPLANSAVRQQPTTSSQQQLERVAELVRQKDVERLNQFGPGLVDALERLVFDHHQALPEVVYREVLPRRGAAFAALEHFNTSDAALKRQAAKELLATTAKQPLGRLAVERLLRLVAAETDQVVWQTVLEAVADDRSEPAARVAYAAIGHPSPDVRRRACEHLADHADPRHAKVLTASLDDPSHSVVCAAVRALGAAGRLNDTEPLQRLQASTNEQVRVESALALVRLGDPAGAAALERLSHSADPQVRRRVAETMGEQGDRKFAATLIRMLDDHATVARAALASLPQIVGEDVSTARDDGPPPTTSERIARWKRWYEQKDSVLRF